MQTGKQVRRPKKYATIFGCGHKICCSLFLRPHIRTHTHTNKLAHTRAFINYVWASLYALLLRHSGARAAAKGEGGGCVVGGVLGRASRRRIKNQFANFARTY